MNLHPQTAFNLAYRAAILRASHVLPVRKRHAFLRTRLAQLKAGSGAGRHLPGSAFRHRGRFLRSDRRIRGGRDCAEQRRSCRHA